MTRLMRTSEVTGRPVVTMAGEDVAQIKDVVYSADGGEVGGFTLAGRGMFSGPLKQSLAWSSVSALGADAVMIRDVDVLTATTEVLAAPAESRGSDDNVLGSQVLTDTGALLGVVTDVILEVSNQDPPQCDVVGYEVAASEALGPHRGKVFVPLPDTLAASGEHLIVPDSTRDFVSQELAGFGEAVEAFRHQLEERR